MTNNNPVSVFVYTLGMLYIFSLLFILSIILMYIFFGANIGTYYLIGSLLSLFILDEHNNKK